MFNWVRMANQRRPGQTFIGCQVDEKLLWAVERGRGRKDRSLFVREAIAEKLRSLGIRVPDELVYPPDRVRAFASYQSMDGDVMNQTMSMVNETPRTSDVTPTPSRKVNYSEKNKATPAPRKATKKKT